MKIRKKKERKKKYLSSVNNVLPTLASRHLAPTKKEDYTEYLQGEPSNEIIKNMNKKMTLQEKRYANKVDGLKRVAGTERSLGLVETIRRMRKTTQNLSKSYDFSSIGKSTKRKPGYQQEARNDSLKPLLIEEELPYDTMKEQIKKTKKKRTQYTTYIPPNKVKQLSKSNYAIGKSPFTATSEVVLRHKESNPLPYPHHEYTDPEEMTIEKVHENSSLSQSFKIRNRTAQTKHRPKRFDPRKRERMQTASKKVREHTLRSQSPQKQYQRLYAKPVKPGKTMDVQKLELKSDGRDGTFSSIRLTTPMLEDDGSKIISLEEAERNNRHTMHYLQETKRRKITSPLPDETIKEASVVGTTSATIDAVDIPFTPVKTGMIDYRNVSNMSFEDIANIMERKLISKIGYHSEERDQRRLHICETGFEYFINKFPKYAYFLGMIKNEYELAIERLEHKVDTKHRKIQVLKKDNIFLQHQAQAGMETLRQRYQQTIEELKQTITTLQSELENEGIRKETLNTQIDILSSSLEDQQLKNDKLLHFLKNQKKPSETVDLPHDQLDTSSMHQAVDAFLQNIDRKSKMMDMDELDDAHLLEEEDERWNAGIHSPSSKLKRPPIGNHTDERRPTHTDVIDSFNPDVTEDSFDRPPPSNRRKSIAYPDSASFPEFLMKQLHLSHVPLETYSQFKNFSIEQAFEGLIQAYNQLYLGKQSSFFLQTHRTKQMEGTPPAFPPFEKKTHVAIYGNPKHPHFIFRHQGKLGYYEFSMYELIHVIQEFWEVVFIERSNEASDVDTASGMIPSEKKKLNMNKELFDFIVDHVCKKNENPLIYVYAIETASRQHQHQHPDIALFYQVVFDGYDVQLLEFVFDQLLRLQHVIQEESENFDGKLIPLSMFLRLLQQFFEPYMKNEKRMVALRAAVLRDHCDFHSIELDSIDAPAKLRIDPLILFQLRSHFSTLIRSQFLDEREDYLYDLQMEFTFVALEKGLKNDLSLGSIDEVMDLKVFSKAVQYVDSDIPRHQLEAMVLQGFGDHITNPALIQIEVDNIGRKKVRMMHGYPMPVVHIRSFIRQIRKLHLVRHVMRMPTN